MGPDLGQGRLATALPRSCLHIGLDDQVNETGAALLRRHFRADPAAFLADSAIDRQEGKGTMAEE